MKKTVIIMAILISMLCCGSLFAVDKIWDNEYGHVHNSTSGKIAEFGYINDKDHGPWHYIMFKLKVGSTGELMTFSVPVEVGSDIEANRMLSIISSAYYTQSTVRVYHNYLWKRQDGVMFKLADRILVTGI